jgi:H+-transporting ATPase
MAPPAGDIENGDPDKEQQRRDTVANDDAELGEYGNLVRYISSYRDGRRMSVSSAGGADDTGKKKHWWSRKAKGPGGEGFETPEEWLNTDMKAGLKSHDIEARRKKTGWNELTTEKENLFLKFLSYFTGPILYGSYFPRVFHDVFN